MNMVKKILFIDDETMLTELAECYFEDHDDYDLIAFNDANESLDYFKANHSNVDFVVCDHQLGSDCGLELTEKFKNIDSRVVCYLITGNVAYDSKLSQGFVKEVLVKPFSFNNLCHKLEQG